MSDASTIYDHEVLTTEIAQGLRLSYLRRVDMRSQDLAHLYALRVFTPVYQTTDAEIVRESVFIRSLRTFPFIAAHVPDHPCASRHGFVTLRK